MLPYIPTKSDAADSFYYAAISVAWMIGQYFHIKFSHGCAWNPHGNAPLPLERFSRLKVS